MRILHLVHQYPPDYIGGTELYTQMLATAQAADGHTVTVFCPAVTTPPSTDQGVLVQRVPLGARSAMTTFLSTFTLPAVNRAWQDTLARTRPQVVHVQHLMGLPAAAIEVLLRRQIPYVVTLHDYYYGCANAMLFTNYDQTLCGGPRLWLNCGRCALARAGHDRLAVLAPGVAPLLGYRQARLRRVLTRARVLIAPTDFVRELYCRWFHLPPNRIRVIPHGIELPAPPVVTRREAQHGLHIAYIGGVAPHKGVHLLVEAVQQLPEAARLTVYGDLEAQPAYVAALRRQIVSPRIELAGHVPHAELYAVLGRVDVVVAPALSYETSSLIVQEASAARVPVIASDIGALRETTLRCGGLVVPAGQVEALRAVLRQLIDDPATLDRLRAQLRPPRSTAAHVADIEAVYGEVLAG
jgi:glycosyltransferase involved in cell wall biosynthesis